MKARRETIISDMHRLIPLQHLTQHTHEIHRLAPQNDFISPCLSQTAREAKREVGSNPRIRKYRSSTVSTDNLKGIEYLLLEDREGGCCIGQPGDGRLK